MMRSYLLMAPAYFAAIMLFFALIQRPMFMIFNRESGHVTPASLRGIYSLRGGVRTDAIAASYFSFLPAIIAIIMAWAGDSSLIRGLYGAYNIAAALLLALGSLSDTVLYKYWHIKLDSFVLPYLRSPKGVTASVSNGYIVSVLGALAVLGVLIWWVLQSVTGSILADIDGAPLSVGEKVMATAAGVVYLGLGFVMVRGLGRRPNNPSVAFFSPDPFLNHSALNPIYSFIYSLSVNDKIEGAFQEFPPETAREEFARIYPPKMAPPATSIFTTDRPNVLFIIWESLSARFVGSLGGERDVMPQFDRLAAEGVFFRHLDCGSFRTDRGLVCLLSGYPAQPTMSVIRMGRKVQHLPAFPKKFKDAGYVTTAIHGGDLDIFHKREYYLTMGHDHLVSTEAFPPDAPQGKWGIHDGEVLDYIFDDIMAKTGRGERWYTTFQTLSSHEPWTVPYARIPGDEVANSFAYVDDALGRFVDRLKETDAWKDLVIVITGDHGCNLEAEFDRSEYAHVPALMIGGAIKQPMQVDTLVSQTDLAATILAQMGLPRDEFLFSRDVFSPDYTYPCTYHAFVNGFMFRDSTGHTVYDNVAHRSTAGHDDERVRKGKVILQNVYMDLAKR